MRGNGFRIFRENIYDGLFGFDLELLESELGNKIVNIIFEGFLLVVSIGNLDLKKVDEPFSKGMELFSPEPKGLSFT